jgi:hypothetical protein
MDIRTGRHVVFMIHAHLVFTTKKRGKVLSSQHLDRLKEIFAAICVDFEAELSCHNAKVVLTDRGDNGQVLIGQSPRHRRTFPQSRVPSLEAFGRRPRCKPHHPDRPSSETLHTFGSRRAHSIISSERTNEVGRLPIDYRSRSLLVCDTA